MALALQHHQRRGGKGMSEKMKVVIGYDGSRYADDAIDDLRRAGLPRNVEAIIVSVAEGIMAPPSGSEAVKKAPVSRRVASAVAQASHALAMAQEWTRLGSARVVSLFPEWEARADESQVCLFP
jgi:hypothetical protein